MSFITKIIIICFVVVTGVHAQSEVLHYHVDSEGMLLTASNCLLFDFVALEVFAGTNCAGRTIPPYVVKRTYRSGGTNCEEIVVITTRECAVDALSHHSFRGEIAMRIDETAKKISFPKELGSSGILWKQRKSVPGYVVIQVSASDVCPVEIGLRSESEPCYTLIDSKSEMTRSIKYLGVNIPSITWQDKSLEGASEVALSWPVSADTIFNRAVGRYRKSRGYLQLFEVSFETGPLESKPIEECLNLVRAAIEKLLNRNGVEVLVLGKEFNENGWRIFGVTSASTVPSLGIAISSDRNVMCISVSMSQIAIR